MYSHINIILLLFTMSFCPLAISNNIFKDETTSQKDMEFIPDSFDWESRKITEGGFDKKTIELKIRKSIDGNMKISLGVTDFSILLIDKKPKCYRLPIFTNRQNNCTIRMRVDNKHVIQLHTSNNWWNVSKFNGVAFMYPADYKPNIKSLILNAEIIEFEFFDEDKHYIYEFKKSNGNKTIESVSQRVNKSIFAAGKCVANLESPLLNKIISEKNLDKVILKNNIAKINIISLFKYNNEIADEIVNCLNKEKLLLPKFNRDEVRERMFENLMVFVKSSIVDKITGQDLMEINKKIARQSSNELFDSFNTVEFAEGSAFSNLLTCASFLENEKINPNAKTQLIKFLNRQPNIKIDENNEYTKLLYFDAEIKYLKHLEDKIKYPLPLDACIKMNADIRK